MTAKEYFEQQTTAENAYYDKKYEVTKTACLNILQNIDSIKNDMKKMYMNFSEINKPFIDYAYFIIDNFGIDEEQKEIIDLLIVHKLITKKYLKEMFDLIPYKNNENAKLFLSYLNQKSFLTESDMTKYLKIINEK